MNKHYYTYKELAEVIGCSKRTLERLIPQMNITKKKFGNSRKVLFNVLDVHSIIEFNKNFNQCNAVQKRYVKELLNYE
tara:strand:- start:530 stop:763 length:234 start_codon:yes stop_codon:yes gene_type:complete